MISSRQFAPVLAALSMAVAACKKTESNSPNVSASDALPISTAVEPRKDPLLLTHTVKKGETLSQIAKRFGIELDQLKDDNKIKNPNLIRIGQILQINVTKISPASREKKDRMDEPGKKSSKENLSLSANNVPTLSYQNIPSQAIAHSAEIGRLVRRYAIDKKLGKVGPPLCGAGVCNAFNSNLKRIKFISPLDALFADQAFYREHFAAPSRDAWKIRRVLDTLSEDTRSGWVKINIHSLKKSFGSVVRKNSEGSMYKTSYFPDGAIVCYDPAPQKTGRGSGAYAHGHVEWITKDQKGNTWHVHAINSEVHGGSPWGRLQLHKAIKKGTDSCHVYILTTPQIKAEWMHKEQEQRFSPSYTAARK